MEGDIFVTFYVRYANKMRRLVEEFEGGGGIGFVWLMTQSSKQ